MGGCVRIAQCAVGNSTAIGTGNTTVWVQVAEKRTDPWAGTPGSTSMAACDPCKNSGTNACADDYRKSVLFTPTWTQVTIKFSDMTRQNWSTTALTPNTLDTSAVYYIHFQMTTAAGTALPNFDIGIADLVALP